MRKNSPRKWLHAVLDLLPVILIPVFMIYSHRHTINNGSIDVPQKEVVDFNQLRTTASGRGTFTYRYSLVGNNNDITLYNRHVYYTCVSVQTIDFDYTDISSILIQLKLSTPSTSDYALNCYLSDNELTRFERVGTLNVQSGLANRSYLQISSNLSLFPTIEYEDFQVIDLTQMYGQGNEPTLEEFKDLYTANYYAPILSKHELIDSGSVTYNDTDIMSQMTYQLYNAVDKYFNMGNVFNLNGVYDWFNLNIFNGTAPIYIYVVWQIVLYEFVMDLLFLLYGLFMWFIDMIQKLMEKPLDSIK